MYRQTSSSLGFSSLSASTTASAMASANITSPRCWQTNAVPSANARPCPMAHRPRPPISNSRSPLTSSTARASSMVRPKRTSTPLSSYTVLPELMRGLPAWAIPDGTPLASEIFLLPKYALAELKALATSQKPSSTSEPNISIHDAVYALVWRTVMAARLKISTITATDNVTFGMPIDGRSQLASLYSPTSWAISPSASSSASPPNTSSPPKTLAPQPSRSTRVSRVWTIPT